VAELFEVDASELTTLEHWLNASGDRLSEPVSALTKKAGDEHANAWRANARRTSGSHGKLYPRTIRNHFTDGPGFAESETGSSSPAARGYEFGSRNQQPHLDGTKAFDKASADFIRAGEQAIAAALESL
jgi:hypothetical protein